MTNAEKSMNAQNKTLRKPSASRRTALAASMTILAALLSGCGGGYVTAGVGFGSGFDRPAFLTWAGTSSGVQVADVNNDLFAVFEDSGCLYNYATGRENPSFCLVSRQGQIRYGAFPMRIVSALSAANTCIAVLVEESSGNFVDVVLDATGREAVAVTSVRPALCV